MGNLTGIVFHFRSRYFKLVDIEWGKDNSFYFFPSQYKAEVGTRLKTEIDDVGRIVLSINEIQSGHFHTKKISRHPSGYFHIKDVVGPGGNREQDGLIGPAFKDTDGFYVFLVACPQAIDTLVEIEDPKPTDIIANLPDSIEPFTVQFAVKKKNVTVNIPTQSGEFLGNGVIGVNIDSLEYGLVIMFVRLGKTSPETIVTFPVRTCYIVR